ncbi:crinkler family protein [Gigaspora margarita]|uniref:Crinkler family protein n=1 Tax=Gigaspora margarita TaxID=4874 RepID=A0A8H3XC31_GIGMA|nr:crinkler family protein [Gigaspora margarita]
MSTHLRNMAKIMLYCLILGDTIEDIFPITISEKTRVKISDISINDFTVGYLKDLLIERERNRLVGGLNIWKVEGVTEGNEKWKFLEERPCTEADIISKLGGQKLSLATKAITELFPTNPPIGIHLIIQPLEQEATITFDNVIKNILKDDIASSFQQCDGSKKMPLKDRDFTEPLSTITSNVTNNLEGSTAKTDFHILASGGAPGIGKTRYGQELFDFLQTKWTLPVQWTTNGYRPHFEYLYLDFGGSIQLDEYDYRLAANEIIGLRIAYEFFVAKNYRMPFGSFRILALPYVRFFIIDVVLENIRRKLALKNTQQLFIFLHIDEFQLIDEWDEQDRTNPPKNLFKNMISALASYMLKPSQCAFVQVFLSGTAPKVIITAKKASKVSFKFVKCPMLSIVSMIQIVDYYAEKCGAETFEKGDYKWKLCYQFLQLIEDTGGLPRALQHLLKICFYSYNNCERTFFSTIHDQFFDKISQTTIERLNGLYNIHKVVKDNKLLAVELLHHCIEEIPVYTNECLDPNDHIHTIENLESDAHIILSRCDYAFDRFLIKTPFFFSLHL